jgi:hypothetical protein
MDGVKLEVLVCACDCGCVCGSDGAGWRLAVAGAVVAGCEPPGAAAAAALVTADDLSMTAETTGRKTRGVTAGHACQTDRRNQDSG